MIAQRTKDALQAAKARGVVLGNPKLHAVRDRAMASVKADADRFAKNVAPIIREIQSTGVASHRAIARALNTRGIATVRGGEWTAVQIGSILRRVDHFASGRSIKQQTNNKQQPKLTPLPTAP